MTQDMVRDGPYLIRTPNGVERELIAEIKRLRAENDDLRRWKALDKPLTAAMAIVNTDMERLRAEIERLRAALSTILLNYGAMLEAHGVEGQRSIVKARAALNQQTTTYRCGVCGATLPTHKRDCPEGLPPLVAR